MISRLCTVWVMGLLLLGCVSVPDSRVSELETRLAKVEGTLEAITSTSIASTDQTFATDPAEQVVMAYIEAITQRDCEAALNYFAPDKRQTPVQACIDGKLTSNRIDSTVVREDRGKIVTLTGSFKIKWSDNSVSTTDSIMLRLEEANGQWFLLRYLCSPPIICD